MKRGRPRNSEERTEDEPKRRRIRREADLERETKVNSKKKYNKPNEELKDSKKLKSRFEIPIMDVNEVKQIIRIGI